MLGGQLLVVDVRFGLALCADQPQLSAGRIHADQTKRFVEVSGIVALHFYLEYYTRDLFQVDYRRWLPSNLHRLFVVLA